MSTKILFVAALIFIGVIAASLPFIGRAENTTASSSSNSTKPASTSVAATQNTPHEDEPQVISLEATPSDFEPAETIVHRGRFLILLQNRTGQRGLNFWLARENQERLGESEPQKRDWKAQVQLGPGTYVIGETGHPEWQATIRVTN
jgi:hypothetical protein